jgi:NADH-quinone oxidoreductase subunit N
VELQSLAIYILCSLKRHSNKSLEAGFKYFLYGSFSSAVMLFGISFLYGVFGSLNLNDISLLISISDYDEFNNLLLHTGLILLLVGFLFKLAVFPFH